MVMETMLRAEANIKEKEITIAFTHDLHSHIEEFQTIEDGKYVMVGGFSRLATAMNQVRENNNQVLVVDGGDYSMGTLYQSLYATDSVELSLLAKMGFDAVTLGNHEFDYGEQALADSLFAAANKNSSHPAMVVSNIDWEASGERGAVIKQGYDAYHGSTYAMIEKGNVIIAIFGIFGKDSEACVNDCPLVFQDQISSAKEIVKEIKAKEDPDLIVCLSHSGTSSDADKSEDEILAREIPEIDVIVSGHSHTILDEPITIGNTYIVGCGCYGMNLGEVSMTQNANGRWSVESYSLKDLNEEVAEDEAVKNEINSYTALIDEKYLYSYGLNKNQVIAYNDITFEDVEEVYTRHEELRLGNIMSDAFAIIGKKYAGLKDDVILGIIPAGYIRDTYVKGDVSVDDVFNSYSLGVGADGTTGYPLVCVYLTGSELRMAAEVDASLSDIITGVSLFCSGMKFSFNEHRLIFNKVTDISFITMDGNETAVENNKLYPIIADLGTAQSLGRIKKTSYGLISLIPKDKDGNEIKNYEDAIIYNGNQEIKAWTAILEYMQSFEKNQNNISKIPAQYANLDGRKNNNTNWNVWDLIRSPNKYAAMIIGGVAAIIAILTAIIVLIVKGIKTKRNANQRK